MALNNKKMTKLEEKNLTKEMCRQGRCGSCGKHWKTSLVIEEELCRQVNAGIMRHPRFVETIQNTLIDNCKRDEEMKR